MDRHIQRFAILGELGSGAMGAVFRARDPQLQRDVAIKVIHQPAQPVRDLLATHPDTVDLRTTGTGDLLAEARLMARLAHPNVLPVYEVGLDGASVFVVMELIAGSDLRTWLETPRTPAAILDVFAQAARGLAAAHAQGIVHRDVKPDNILVGLDGRARVADFGLSRLTASRELLRVEEDVGGTPHYMAPELWAGGAATDRSDVYALCTALREALGDARVPAAVRAAIAAGTADDPAVRPKLDAVIAALAPPPSRRGVWIAGGVVALAGAIAIGLVVRASTSAPAPCVADGVHLPHPRLDAVQARLGEIDKALVDACTAEQRGAISTEQARIRVSCLERRAIEVDVRAERLAAGKPGTAHDVPGAGGCDDIVARPLAADRGLLRALYLRFMGDDGTAPSASAVAAMVAVAHDAHALGDDELEARADYTLGVRQLEVDDLAGADATFAHAYDLATTIHSELIAVRSLVKRAAVATERHDGSAASTYGQLAVDLAAKSNLIPVLRAEVHEELARAQLAHGEPGPALEHLRIARDELAKDPQHDPHGDIALRITTMQALQQLTNKNPELLVLARETAGLAHDKLGDADVDYGLTLDTLAVAYRMNGDAPAAIEPRQHALAIYEKTFPANHSAVLNERMNLADDLYGNDRFEEARKLAASVIAASEGLPALASSRPTWLADYGAMLYRSGHRDEGLRQLEDGVEQMMAQQGADHPSVIDYRRALVGFLIEAGKLDDAERKLAAIEHAVHDHKDALAIARIDAIERARMQNARGKYADAERRVRAALAAWPELHGDDGDREDMLHQLGDALVGERRYKPALAAYDEATALLVKRHEPPSRLAEIEVGRAKAKAALHR